MATPTAELMRGRDDRGLFGGPPVLRKLANGLSGTRHFLINTNDQDAAMSASNLPAVGDSWSAALASLKCSSVIITPVAGTDNPATLIGGYCWAAVEYESAQSFGGGPRPTGYPGLVYTRIATSTTSYTRYNDARLDPDYPGDVPVDPAGRPIDNRRGAPTIRGLVQAEITHYPLESDDPPEMQRIVKLHTRHLVSKDDVVLPNVFGWGFPLEMEAGQVQYAGFNMDPDGELKRIVHLVNLDADFFYRGQLEDSKGNPVGDMLTWWNYNRAEFAGLWPTSSL